MGIFENIKRNKMYIMKNIMMIFTAIFIFELFFCHKPEIGSDEDLNNSANIENNIIEASKSIVGISKTYEISNEGWGSGVIISKSGYILTNAHVSGELGNVCFAIISTTEKYKAKVIWVNNEIDLAVISIDHQFENCINLGDSSELKIGEHVFSIGNPISYDFKNSVSSGIVSGLNRKVEVEDQNGKAYMTNLIQTDISINSGNSGGALINESGKIIGITTLKITSAESMSFSVPIDIVKPIIKKIESEGTYKNVTLEIVGYDKYSIDSYNSSINLNEGGVFVAIVNRNSESELAGIKSGDIIIKVYNYNVDNMLELRQYIYEKNPGEEVNLTIKRDKKVFDVRVKLKVKE